jgi:hypothetical protein
MKKLNSWILLLMFFCLIAQAQIQSGENIEVTNTDCGKVY